MKNLLKSNKPIIAIIAIFTLEALAIWRGIDGIALSLAIASITGLGGYEIGIHKKPK